jgi:small conductance mechanosensitive channel
MLDWWHDLTPALRDWLSVAMRVGVIVLLALVVWAGAGRALAAVQRRVGQGAADATRSATLSRVVRHVAGTTVVLVGGALVLEEVGISVSPILATAGVAGVAIGFGAQWIVKDLLGGFFLLLEDQVRQGEVVEIAGKSGVVEEVTLRYVRLRDFEGNVVFVPSGQITVVENRTRDFAFAVVDVGVAYGADVDRAVEVVREVLEGLRADEAWSARLPEPAEVLGVESLGASAVVLRGRLKVSPPIERWNVRRELHRRIKLALDDAGIQIPFPQLTVHRAPSGRGVA